MKKFAQVAIPPLDKILSYLIPESLTEILEIGHLVQVWIGKRIEQGFIVGFSSDVDFDTSK